MGRSGKEHLQSNGNSLCKGPGIGPSLECLRNREEASGWSEQGKEGRGGVHEGWGVQLCRVLWAKMRALLLTVHEMRASGSIRAEQGRNDLTHLYGIPLAPEWRTLRGQGARTEMEVGWGKRLFIHSTDISFFYHSRFILIF